MWMLIGVAGFVLSVAVFFLTLIGLISPKVFNKYLGYMPTRKKILFRGALLFFVLLVVGVIGAINDSPVKSQQVVDKSQQAEKTNVVDEKVELKKLESDDKTKRDEDLGKLIEFHQKLVIGESSCNNINKKWAAQKNSDIYAMYDLAKEGEAACLNSQLPDVPDFNSKDVQGKADRILEASKAASTSAWSVYNKMKDSLNEGRVSPETMSKIKQSISFKDSSVMVEAVAVIEAYKLLGIDVDKIDTKNGGVKK